MPNLYDQSAAFRELLERKENDEFAEITEEEVSSAFKTLEDKVESVAGYIKELNGEAEKFKTEGQRLTARAQSLSNRAGWFKRYLKGCLEAANIGKYAAGVHKIRLQNNPGYSIEFTGKPEDLLKQYPDFVEEIPPTPRRYVLNTAGITAAVKAKPDLKLPKGLKVVREQHIRVE